MASPIPPDEKHRIIAAALSAIDDGKSIRQIAEEHGIAASTVHKWILGSVPDEYREAQVNGIAQRIVDADQQLDEAASPVDVTRAAARCRLVRFDAERRLSKLWGQKTEISGADGLPLIPDTTELARRLHYLNATLRKAGAIDIEPVKISAPKPTTDMEAIEADARQAAAIENAMKANAELSERAAQLEKDRNTNPRFGPHKKWTPLYKGD